jgi:predicted transcriptional regulator
MGLEAAPPYGAARLTITTGTPGPPGAPAAPLPRPPARPRHFGRHGRKAAGMLAYMKRTTVKLPDELDSRLRHEAKRRGLTISELTREAIESHLGAQRGRRKLIGAAAGHSGSHDISVRIEQILREEVFK